MATRAATHLRFDEVVVEHRLIVVHGGGGGGGDGGIGGIRRQRRLRRQSQVGRGRGSEKALKCGDLRRGRCVVNVERHEPLGLMDVGSGELAQSEGEMSLRPS